MLLIAVFAGGVFLTLSAVREATRFQTSAANFLLSSPFAVVLVFVSFAYAGLECRRLYRHGDELRRNTRLPRSLLLGPASSRSLYILLNVSYLMVVPASELAGVEEVGFVVGQRLWGTAVADSISMLIAVTLLVPDQRDADDRTSCRGSDGEGWMSAGRLRAIESTAMCLREPLRCRPSWRRHRGDFIVRTVADLHRIYAEYFSALTVVEPVSAADGKDARGSKSAWAIR